MKKDLKELLSDWRRWVAWALFLVVLSLADVHFPEWQYWAVLVCGYAGIEFASASGAEYVRKRFKSQAGKDPGDPGDGQGGPGNE